MKRTLAAGVMLAAVLVSGTACGSDSTPASSSAAAPSPATSPDTGGDFCELARQKGGANLEAIAGDSGSPGDFGQVLANLDDLAAAAPSEIHADFARVDTFEHELFDNDGQVTGRLAQEADGPDLKAAMQHVATYLDRRCGIHA